MKTIRSFLFYTCLAALLFSSRNTSGKDQGKAIATVEATTEGISSLPENRETLEKTIGVTTKILMDCLEAGINVKNGMEGHKALSVIREPALACSFSPTGIPEYNGEPYTVINGNIPYFTKQDLTTEPFESYSNLDSLGRCGTAYANVCTALIPDEEREEIGMIKPSGWKTAKYPGFVEGNFLFNRCHLIAYMLAGENANEKNLITGTRYLNVIGMLPFEDMVSDYIRVNPDNHVLYRVTPIYKGDDLLASGVLMEAYSVEDSGSGICFNVYCYNVQPGITINYSTGNSYLDPEYSGKYVTESVIGNQGKDYGK